MGIEDIQISEELETNAPSIKYSGNEGPKSPQEMQQMMMAQLEEEYLKYVDDMIEQGIETYVYATIYGTSNGRRTNVWWQSITTRSNKTS